MRKFESYFEAENWIIGQVVEYPDFVTSTYEKFGMGFILVNPVNNRNFRSNYEYADKFFDWLLTGEKQLSEELLKINPWVARFVDTANLPENFSASYGWKIQEQLKEVFEELGQKRDSRRGYINILLPSDGIIRATKTTHEYPCTIGLHFFIRENRLHLMVNMRSNNLYSVMPYDVYNFTRLQLHMCSLLNIDCGWYYHQINSAHVFKGDVRRWLENRLSSTNRLKNEIPNRE